MVLLGTFACAVIWWVIELMPDYVTSILMCSSWVVFNIVPFSTAFSSFAGTTFWLLLGAIGIGVGVAQCGLLNRTSLIIMSKFPASFKGMTTALYVAGNIINPLIPSAVAKISIAAPFAKSIGEKLGFEKGSEGMGGLFAAVWLSIGVLYPIFLSASILNYTLVGLMPKEIAAEITWTSWLSATWVWGLVVMVLGYLVIQILYKPQGKPHMDPDFIKEELAKLGPISRNEKIVSLILALSLVLWMTERIHHINAALVALTALMLMLGLGIFGRDEFREKISWDSILFIGGVLNLATLFPALNIDKWIAAIIGPYLQPLISNMYLFVVVLSLLLFLLRFVLVSQTATLTIFVVLLVPFAQSVGIDPLIPAFIVLTSVNIWNVFYQNTTFLAGYYAAIGMVKYSQTIKMSFAYMAINIIALMACVPAWKLMGMIP